jgi:hypothetical protein
MSNLIYNPTYDTALMNIIVQFGTNFFSFYLPLVFDSENSYSLFQIFSGQKRNMEQENARHDIANFTHELTPEYIKAKVEKIFSCSSGPDLFCEIFDCERNKITVDELIERYYHNSYDCQTAPDTDAGEIPADNNSGNQTILEEQEEEQELNPVRQMESIPVHSDRQMKEKEQGISNNNIEGYPCYYCDYCTNNNDDYEQHVIIKHPGRLAYPNKAEIEKRGLKAQGKSCEI